MKPRRPGLEGGGGNPGRNVFVAPQHARCEKEEAAWRIEAGNITRSIRMPALGSCHEWRCPLPRDQFYRETASKPRNQWLICSRQAGGAMPVAETADVETLCLVLDASNSIRRP